MRLLLIGCEYAGKRTLATAISEWMIRAMEIPDVRWHSNFVVPDMEYHLTIGAQRGGTIGAHSMKEPNSLEDEEQIMALRPAVLEQLQRHNIWRHLQPDMAVTESDQLMIGFYYDEAVYAPLYYGYGGPGTFADRRRRARAWDAELLKLATDWLLVLVTATPDAIRQRMRESPHPKGVLREQDVDTVLAAYSREYGDSLVHRRITLDTTEASVQETLAQFLEQARPHFSRKDLLRLATAKRASAS